MPEIISIPKISRDTLRSSVGYSFKNINMIIYSIIKNHEVWITCGCCGDVFDARWEGQFCPKCNTKWTK